MRTLSVGSPSESGDEHRLVAFGLSSVTFHDGLRRGASRAGNRSTLALESSAGTDIYHDGMEDLHRLLKPSGWRLLPIDGQPRLVHPEGKLTFTVSSGINVGGANMRTPRTRKKGSATRNSLAAPEVSPGLFGDTDGEIALQLVKAAENAPFYFLLCERVTRGSNGLMLEFSEPAGMTDGGSVNRWGDRIGVAYLSIEGDAETFDAPDNGDDEFDVPVEPR